MPKFEKMETGNRKRKDCGLNPKKPYSCFSFLKTRKILELFLVLYAAKVLASNQFFAQHALNGSTKNVAVCLGS